MRQDDEAERSNTLGALLTRVRRYWWLVLAVTAVALLGGFVATVTSPTTYVGRTSLIVSSNDRSPDQDAVLVQGYVDYFNDSAYQEQLLRQAGVKGDITLSASSSATSPILVVSATTPDAQTAQTDAISVARAFMDDINDIHTTKNAEKLATLQAQLQAALNSTSSDAQSVVSDLQNQIDQINSDTVNTLQQLQTNGGVSTKRPSLLSNVVPAGAGGLLLGVLAATALARSSRRIHGRLDVTDKLGLPTLVELPRRRNRAARARQERRLGQLANIVRARFAEPGVVAVAQPEDGCASSIVARRLALEWTRQGYPTVLVSADDGVSVSDARESLEREVEAGHFVVVDVPALVRSAAAQAVCQAADHTVLVVDTKTTRVPTAREAVAVLRGVGASVAGVVVATVRRGEGKGAAAPSLAASGRRSPERVTSSTPVQTGERPAGETAEKRPEQAARVGGHPIQGNP